MSTTYRAIEVKKPGAFSEVRKPLLEPGMIRYVFASRRVGVCYSDSATVEGLFRLVGLACRVMKSSGGSIPLVLVSGAGLLVSAWVSDFSAALAAIASSAAIAIS